MSASKVLETLLVCTCLAQSVLSNDINDDFVCDKVEKKFFSPSVLLVAFYIDYQLWWPRTRLTTFWCYHVTIDGYVSSVEVEMGQISAGLLSDGLARMLVGVARVGCAA